MRRSINLLTIAAVCVVTTALHAFSISDEQNGIYQTKHNLLKGMILPKGAEEPELCVWCHIPHDSLSGDTQSPKWLQQGDNETLFNVYGMDANTTASSNAPEPDVMVRVCLTCHDGVNAPNISLYSESAPQKFNINTASPSNEPMPQDALVHSHPVGKTYAPFSPSGSKASLRPETYILRGWSGAKTIHDLVSEGTIRCTSCHDPHTTNSLFLRTSNRGSALCKGCHDK